MDWEALAWSRGVRRFRDKANYEYALTVKRGWTGRYGAAAVVDDAGHRCKFARSDLLVDGGARFDLHSGETLRIRILSGLEERVDVTVDGRPTTFAPCKAMKPSELARRVRRASRFSAIQAALMGCVGVGLMALATAAFVNGSGAKALFVLALGALFAYATRAPLAEAIDLRRGEGSRIMRALRECPETIGWVYPKEERRAVVGAFFAASATFALVVKFVDRAEIEVLMDALDLEPAMRLIQKKAPNVAIGFSDDQRAQYETLVRE
jgi:hypothetical protein